MSSKAFRYNFAVVCCIPQTYSASTASRREGTTAIDLDRARAQHYKLIETLRKLGISVLQLPADERYPDCAFVEDCAVVINGTALICRPASNSRLGEVSVIRTTLKRDLGLKIVELDSDKAIIEGGDVLWTGKEIIVGLSGRTNVYGAQQVAKAFPEYAVTTIHVPKEYVHLKNFLAVASPDVMVVSRNEHAQAAFKEVMANCSFGYKVLHVDEDLATSVLYANGMLLHLTGAEIPKSHPVFESKLDARMEVEFSELSKACGTLHSCCILVGRYKHPKAFPTTIE